MKDEAGLRECQRDAARFQWCQNNPKLAQAMFWNYSSRKDRAKAIDAAIAKGEKAGTHEKKSVR